MKSADVRLAALCAAAVALMALSVRGSFHASKAPVSPPPAAVPAASKKAETRPAPARDKRAGTAAAEMAAAPAMPFAKKGSRTVEVPEIERLLEQGELSSHEAMFFSPAEAAK